MSLGIDPKADLERSQAAARSELIFTQWLIKP
jgi:hypothetical protein